MFFTAPRALPLIAAVLCLFLAGPWVDREGIVYQIAGGLMLLGIVLWVLTWLANRGSRGGRPGSATSSTWTSTRRTTSADASRWRDRHVAEPAPRTACPDCFRGRGANVPVGVVHAPMMASGGGGGGGGGGWGVGGGRNSRGGGVPGAPRRSWERGGGRGDLLPPGGGVPPPPGGGGGGGVSGGGVYGGGCGIRTREGLHPTRFPSERHRPLGESSARKVTGNGKHERTWR